MRIGIDARLWNETGVGRYIRNLVWELEKIDKQNEYVVFVTKGTRDLGLGTRRTRFKIIETDIHWHTVSEQMQFPKILEKERLDLVHFPYFSVPIRYNHPFVITIHDLIINHFPTGKASTHPLPVYYAKRFAYQYILKQAAKKAKKVITVSHATREEIIEHLGVSPEKIAVTYEGVEDGLNAKCKMQNAKVQVKSQKFLLYVGNAYPHKNVERLIEAFSRIKKQELRIKDLRLVLVGKENYFYNEIKKKVLQLGLQNDVVFTGSVTDEELTSLYKHAMALVFPSLMEGFGLPGLEAMQQGCLVLASDIPIFKEIYQDSAVYFNPLAVSSLHDTIRQVLERPAHYVQYKEKGKALAKSFSWKTMAEQTLHIYEQTTST